MAHKIAEILDKNESKRPCDSGRSNYQFDHLNTPCVLSSVFSVPKGLPCAIYKSKESIIVKG
jgi:hypothetical protein